MAQLRIETITYQTGKIYAELYYPDDAVIPLATTEPIFPNSDIAVQRATEMFESWMSLLREDSR